MKNKDLEEVKRYIMENLMVEATTTYEKNIVISLRFLGDHAPFARTEIYVPDSDSDFLL